MLAESRAPEGTDTILHPASLQQERFWSIDRAKPGNTAYNIAVRWRLLGALDAPTLAVAFNEIIARHESLRTAFVEISGELFQSTWPSLHIDLPEIDLTSLAASDREAEADRLALLEARESFDLETGPLVRARLIKLTDRDHILFVTVHHIISDGWSVGIIADELASLYESHKLGLPPLPPLSLQYSDYTSWQAKKLAESREDVHLAYWKRRLRDLPLFEVQPDRPRPAVQTSSGAISSRLLDRELTDALQQLAASQGTTLFTLYLAALDVCLRCKTGLTDIVIGSPIAGRLDPGFEALNGPFINVLVLRSDISGDPTYLEVLARVRDTVFEAISHQETPFEQLLNEVKPPSDSSRHPLFQVNFVYQRSFIKPREFAGLKLIDMPSRSQGALYDLNFFTVERPEGWRASCEYNTDLYDETTVSTMLCQFESLLKEIVESPARQITELTTFGGTPRTDNRGRPQLVAANYAEPQSHQSDFTTSNNGHPPTLRLPDVGDDSSKGTGEDYVFPTTLAQRRFWMLDQLSPGDASMNLPAALRVAGSIDAAVLQRCIDELMRRHEILRTSIELSAGQPVQLIKADVEYELRILSVERLPPREIDQALDTIRNEEAHAPFVLSVAPLFRATLVRIAEGDSLLLFTTSHLISDAWSVGMLMRELTALYEAFSSGLPSPLPDLRIQYADYAQYQLEFLESDAIKEHRNYWQKQLEGDLPVLNFPTDRPAGQARRTSSGCETLLLPSALTEKLKVLCKRVDVTLFTLILAAFKVVLHRYTGQTDILVGSPFANRTEDTEEVIGPFANPLCLRSNLAGDPSFAEFLTQLRSVTLGALAHGEMPFEQLVENIRALPIKDRNPLFQFYFVYQKAFLPEIKIRGITLTPLPTLSPGTPFELFMAIIEREEGLRGELEYNCSLFDATTARRILGSLEAVLDAVTKNPDCPLSRLAILPLTENDPVRIPPQPHKRTVSVVPELFEARTSRSRDMIAVASPALDLTYGELSSRANRLAHHLIRLGVKPGSTVALRLTPSTDSIIAMLAILKAGASYLPFDASISADEIGPILAESNVSAVLVSGTQVLDSPPLPAMPTVLIDRDWSKLSNLPDTSPTLRISPTSPACIVYSRDSNRVVLRATMTHAGLTYAADTFSRIGVDSKDVLLQSAPLHSPLAAVGIWGTLLNSARLVISPAAADSRVQLVQAADRHHATLLAVPLRRLRTIINASGGLPASLKSILAFGGTMSVLDVQRLRKKLPNCRLFNCYGTPEVSPIAFAHEAVEDEPTERSVPIGKAVGLLAKTVDSNLRPLPIGAVGELCIGPDLSAGESIVRTGDLARIRPDGNVELVGRVEEQIEVRGYRIAFGEIESAIRQHPSVADALVSRRDDQPDRDPGEFTAYVTVRERSLSTNDLTSFLRQRFPREALPSRLVIVDALPLEYDRDITKLEPARLETGSLAEDKRVKAPRDKIESEIAQFWAEAFCRDQVGVDEDFFDLGGNSLMAATLMMRIAKAFEKKLPVASIFQAPTIEQLGELVRQEDISALQSVRLVPMQARGDRPVFFVVDGGVIFRQLGRLLGLDQPMYALVAPEEVERESPYTIERIAAYHAQTMIEAQPEGQFFLGGYCVGGIVAYETARQLRLRGRQVALLVLFDTGNPASMRFRSFVARQRERFEFHRKNIRQLGSGSAPRYALNKLGVLLKRIGGKIASFLHRGAERVGVVGQGEVEEDLTPLKIWLTDHYRPEPCPSRILLLKRTQDISGRYHDPQFGWGRVAKGGVDIFEIGGDHTEIFEEPNIQIMARRLRPYIFEAEAEAEERQRAGVVLQAS